MDLRKQKQSYQSFSKDSKQQSPYSALRGNSGDRYQPDKSFGRIAKPQADQMSPGQQDAYEIEQRHEELKRQIALKEKQLAAMTGERESINTLRYRLGMERGSQQVETGPKIQINERQGRLSTIKVDSKPKNLSSVSPDQLASHQSRPGLVGMSSTHLRMNTSQEQTTIPRRIPSKQLDFERYKEQEKQLQWNPTRLVNRPPPAGSNGSSASPLRSKSRSKSKGAIGSRYNPDESYAHLNPLQESVDRNSASPLRYSPPQRFQNDADERPTIRPQPVPQIQPFVQNPRDTNTGFGSNLSFKPNPSMGSVGLDQREQLYRDRVEQMTLDNQSLQRRLNQVSSELERITRENEEIRRGIRMTEGDVNRMDRLVNNRDDIDAQNNIMQQDLDRIKMANADLSSKLKEEEIDTQNISVKLTSATAGKKNLILESENLNSGINQKVRMFEDIQRDKQMTQQKLNNVNNELERLNRDNLQFSKENIDMETHVARLQSERRDLMMHIEQLTQEFDFCVQDLTRERRDMDESNDWHTKLIVSKIIFSTLEIAIKNRKQVVFTETKQYCQFDRECHSKLSNLANILEKLGQFQMRVGLNQWYDKSLRPLNTRVLNDDISIIIDCQKLQAKYFYAWRLFQQKKMDVYHHKTNAIEMIWHHLERDARKEKKRAFDIWKQKQQFRKQSLKVLQRVINGQKNRTFSQAMLKWVQWSQLLEHSCRLRVLQGNTSEKLMLSQVFYQMRQTLRFKKMIRQRKLNAYLKGWQDFVTYNRYLMQSNMAQIRFLQVNQEYNMRSVFSALRQNAEQKKFTMVAAAVSSDMNVVIDDTDKYVKNAQNKLDKANKKRAGQIVITVLGKKLFSYFKHWRNVKTEYHNNMQTKVKDIVIQTYIRLMKSYFQGWKKHEADNERKKKVLVVQEMQQKAEAAQSEALAQAKAERGSQELVRSSQRKMVDKTFKNLYLRQVRNCLFRWKDICVTKQEQEAATESITKKLRRRLMKQAFEIYVAFLRKSQEHSRNVIRANHYEHTLKMRQFRKCYNSWCYYTSWSKRVKQIWSKVLYRLDFYQRQKATKRWRFNAHQKYKWELENKQKAQVANIEDLKKTLGGHNKVELQQQNEIGITNKEQEKIAYRQIANFFQRAYTRHTGDKFYIWKMKTKGQAHKEMIIKRSLEHYNKRYLEAIQRVFIRFLSDERKKEYLAKIKQTEIECKAAQTVIKFNLEQQQKKAEEETIMKAQLGGMNDVLNAKVTHTMEWMERINKNYVCRSKKRMIFDMWVHVQKQEKAFCFAVKNVLEKSLYKHGFTQIIEVNRDNTFTMNVHRALRRFALRAEKINCSDSFNHWKMFALSKVDNKLNQVHSDLNDKITAFETYRDIAKDVNNARVLKFMVERSNKNVWRGWVNVVKHFKLIKAKEAEFKHRQQIIRKHFAIRHWEMRYDKTRYFAARVNQGQQIIKFQYFKAVFFAWKKQWKQDKRYITLLSNLEKFMRTKISNDSFKALKSFSTSKKLVMQNKRNKGTQEILQLANNRYLKIVGAEFQKFKSQTMYYKQKSSRLSALIGQMISKKLRTAFDTWHKKQELASLAKELYEAGPVRAQYWQAEQKIKNLLEFMKKEHYTPEQIEKFFGDVCKTNDGLLNKYVSHWQIKMKKDRKILPIVWNRWRAFVGLRKLLKYHFRTCHNQTRQDGKADLQKAFKIWKMGHKRLAEELWKLPVSTLESLALRTSQELEECSEMIAENQSISNHLILQRDEFLNYYIKGQILAMALMRDRSKFTKHQGVSRWLDLKHRLFVRDLERAIRDGSYLHANLQERERVLNEENDNLEKENAELAQFTRDGAIVKQNMLILKDECQKIADRIADTDDDYNELKEQFEQLTKDVAEMEAKAAAAKAAGGNPKFTQAASMKQKPKKDDEAPPMTEEEIKLKARFDRLAEITQGAALR